MAIYDAIAWTSEMDSLIGTMSDEKVGAALGISPACVRTRRLKLQLPTYRSRLAPVTVPCANCGMTVTRKQRDMRRAVRLFCSKICADAGQKKRDSDMLRYGPGWKNTRAKVRQRDRTCRNCAKTPEQNGRALHVHHLVPYRFGGTNRLENLVALCDSCHHVVEAIMATVLSSIPLVVSLEKSVLTITLDGATRWLGSVPGADSLTGTG